MKADQKIVVSENGPYVVTGSVPLSIQAIIPDKNGFSWEWREGKRFQAPETYKLCRPRRSQYDPLDPVLQHRREEIQHQPLPQTAQPQVCEHLSRVDGQ